MDRAIKVLAWCAAIMAGILIALMELEMWQSKWSVLPLVLILPLLTLAILTLMGRQVKALAWYSAVMVCILIPAWGEFALSIVNPGGPPLCGRETFLASAVPIILILPTLGLAVLILIRKRQES